MPIARLHWATSNGWPASSGPANRSVMRPALTLGAIGSVIAIGLAISAVGRHFPEGDASSVAVEPRTSAQPNPLPEKSTRQPGSDPPAEEVGPAPSAQRSQSAAAYARIKP